jgi:hypothetical protein
MAGQLQRSARVFEFLGIMRRMPALPRPLRPCKACWSDAAVQLVAPALRGRIGLGAECDRPAWQLAGVRQAGAAADRIVLRTHPAVQACRRLGLATITFTRGEMVSALREPRARRGRWLTVLSSPPAAGALPKTSALSCGGAPPRTLLG